MAIVNLTDTCVFENYLQLFDSCNVGEGKESPPLAALSHFAFAGLTWRIVLYPCGKLNSEPNFASVYVRAVFGSEEGSVRSVWASWTLTVVAVDTKDNLQNKFARAEYLLGGCTGRGSSNAFLQEALKAAVRKDGHLELKLELSLCRIVDLLKCRQTLRALLSDNRHADFKVIVEGRTFDAHKAILKQRCGGFSEVVPDGTTAEAYSAFLGAIYCDQFDFLAKWELALGVLQLAEVFGAEDLRRYCDDALAEMVPNLRLADLLHILSIAISKNAPLTRTAVISRLAEMRDLKVAPEWTAFKNAASKEVLADILEADLERQANGDTVTTTVFYHAAEINLTHTWSIASAQLLQAVAPRPTSVTTSPASLEHKAFPGLKWQLEFHPHGNSQDRDYQQGFASLYLKANFRECDVDFKAVYANWKASITTKDGTQVSTPVAPDYTLYTGAKEMKFGFANAFPLEQYNQALISKTANPTEFSLDISLQLTLANIPEILKCRRALVAALFDKTHADVDIDVYGVLFKAPKWLLAARSPTFAAMFASNMQEATSGKVQVKETTSEAFTTFLGAVGYVDWDFLSDMDATIDVLNLADRYGVADLKQYCDEALAHFADAGNVLTILPHAALHNAEATKAACVEILCANKEIMKSKDWSEFKGANEKIAFDIAEALVHYHKPRA